MKLTIVAAGKLKDAALVALCSDYLRRAQPYVQLDVIEVRDLPGLRAHWSRHDGPRILLDAAARFGQFTGPVRVLWGEGDRYFPTTLGRRLSESFPDAVFTTVPAARTFLPLDHPSQVASEVTAVLPGSHQGLS